MKIRSGQAMSGRIVLQTPLDRGDMMRQVGNNP